MKGAVHIHMTARSQAIQGVIENRMHWTIRGDGSLDLICNMSPQATLPPLPRIGVVMGISKDLRTLTWYGHGPHENYSDRKASCPVGLWKSRVDQQYVPYPRPQETGNKEGVRWLALTDESERGVVIVAEQMPIAASALPFSAHDLAAAKHTHELKPRDEVTISLDVRHCGLGNSSCGPGVLQEFAVPVQPYTLHVSFRPVDALDRVPEIARQRYE